MSIFFRYFPLKNNSIAVAMQLFWKENYQKNLSPKILRFMKTKYFIRHFIEELEKIIENYQRFERKSVRLL